MSQRLKIFWKQSEGKRILTAGLMLLAVLLCVGIVLSNLNGKASKAEAADVAKPDSIKLSQEEKKQAEIMQALRKQITMAHSALLKELVQRASEEMIPGTAEEMIPETAEETAQETGAGAVQALTEEEIHLQEIIAMEEAILPGQYPIMGESSIQVQQMVDFFNINGGSYPSEALGTGGAPDIETFCQIYYDESVQEGVRPEVAFAQTMKETGWLQYGGDASISQYNFAGLGTTGGGVPGNSYADVRTGVRAQIQHLKAYATEQSLNQECVDNRYTYVTKGCAPFVEWLGQNENPEGYGWATGMNYGFDIVDMIHTMRGL